MDDHFGDLYGIISDREIEISYELAQFVLEYETLLTTTSDICGELDRFEVSYIDLSPELTEIVSWRWHVVRNNTSSVGLE